MESFQNYRSPFSWRYGSPEMRSLWSEVHKRKIWRRIWLSLAGAQSAYGLVSPGQLRELESQVENVDMDTALRIEAEIHHDLMAELKTYAAQCPQGGGILHLGATSTDIEDNADALRIRSAIDLVVHSLAETLLHLADQIEKYAGLPIMAYTHLQPAEPSTLGYRLAVYARDLLEDWEHLCQVRAEICGKGFKGAVGTGAAFADLIGRENLQAFEDALSQSLDLPFFSVTTQTYPRKQDYSVLSALAALGASLHKFALDLRILQSPAVGEISEPFARQQVGSSAMPFKRNPINAEKIDSLARQLSVYPQIAWQNTAQSILERTLDDSANRRSILPEAFLLVDELLKVIKRIVRDLNIHAQAIERNFETYAPFAVTERVMMLAVKRGGDRQSVHELLRGHALAAWDSVQHGRPNPLLADIKNDPELKQWMNVAEIEQLSDLHAYTGLAKERSLALTQIIRSKC